MSTTRVSNYLIEPSTNRARHPATMGSSWSCNMFKEVNEDTAYMASVPGLEFISRVIWEPRACVGVYVKKA